MGERENLLRLWPVESDDKNPVSLSRPFRIGEPLLLISHTARHLCPTGGAKSTFFMLSHSHFYIQNAVVRNGLARIIRS